MKEEGKKEKKEKENKDKEKKNEKKDEKKSGKRESVVNVKKISKVPVPQKTSRSLSEIMSAEAFRSSSLLVTLTLIVVFGTVLLVLVTILIASFRLPLLTMASNNFLAGPVCMVLGCCLGILLAITGFFLVCKKHFNLYIGLAMFSLLAFTFQLVAVVFAFLLRDNIDSDFNKVNVEAEMALAAQNSDRMDVWDTIQSRYQCCGGRGNSGFLQWEDHLNGTYPDSCCTVSYPDCGRQAHRTLQNDYTATVYERIHVRGCITVVGGALREQVMPLLLGWGLIGVLVCLAELMLLFLCLLFAQHLRRSSLGGRARLAEVGDTTGDNCPVHGERKVSTMSTMSNMSTMSRHSNVSSSSVHTNGARRGSVAH